MDLSDEEALFWKKLGSFRARLETRPDPSFSGSTQPELEDFLARSIPTSAGFNGKFFLVNS